MISLCIATYRAHAQPNVASIAAVMEQSLAGAEGELVVALNGLDRGQAGVPDGAVTVDLGVNRGVAPAWNAAARASSGEVLVFCNDDVELGAGALARLAGTLALRPDVGVVGPDGSYWDLKRGKLLPKTARSHSEGDGLTECDVVSGFLFACLRETWESVGGFDEFYAPASWEEVDFCTAVRASGKRCFEVTGVSCRHEWGVSRRQMPWARARWDGRSETWRSIHRRNRRHFLAKWADQPVAELGAGDP